MDNNEKKVYNPSPGIWVSIHKDNMESIVPIECPVCKLLMRDATDVFSYKNSSCCSTCEIVWVDSCKEKWDAGWRPTKKDLDKYRKRRSKDLSYQVVLIPYE